MAAVIKAQRDPRAERLQKQRADIEKFIKEEIMAQIINKAHAFGESLSVCREI